jgi:hypothetical protein
MLHSSTVNQPIISDEDSIYENHRKLLSALSKQGNVMKNELNNFKKLHLVSHTKYYDNLEFSEDDLKNLSSMVSMILIIVYF